MALLKIRPNGLSLTEPAAVDRPVTFGRRGCITGWSRQASMRHRRWLQAVEVAALDGHGYAFTLTTRLQSDGPEALYRMLEKWWKRQQTRGALRGHWVRENHADGRPHFHLGLFYRDRLSKRELALAVRDWVEVAAELQPRAVGQDAKPMDHDGWAKYCAKHSARSVTSYQRTGLPKGWERSGRLWGHWGDWPALERQYVIDAGTFVVLRRMLLDWRAGDAAAALERARAAVLGARSAKGKRQAEHHVRCAHSRVQAIRDMEANAVRTRRGLSEWVAQADALGMLRDAAERAGGLVVLVEEWADADGVVHPWRVLYGDPGSVERVPEPTSGADVAESNASTPDRDALLHLHSPVEPDWATLAAGAEFAAERRERRRRPVCARPVTRRQDQAVRQPGISARRRDHSRQLLALGDLP